MQSLYEAFQDAPLRQGKRENEKTLSTWIQHRREDRKKGRLNIDLETAIENALPWFSWDPIGESHAKMILDMQSFYEAFQDAPVSRGERENEKTLSKWIQHRKEEKKKGKLSIDLETKIKSSLPWFPWTQRIH